MNVTVLRMKLDNKKGNLVPENSINPIEPADLQVFLLLLQSVIEIGQLAFFPPN